MVALLGELFLILSAFFSLVLFGGIYQHKIRNYYKLLPNLIFASIFGSFLCLEYLYIVSDFSVLNVFINSHTAKPLIYKISGVWGNHEGSMLLFVLLISLFTTLFAWKNKPEFSGSILRIQALIIILFLSYVIFASNPFITTVNIPSNGQGLNPLLQDIGLATHPPMLYTGYCGFSLALSFAIVSLLRKKVEKSHLKPLKPWILASWGFLTFGIGLGSWWAYRELGWGGFWFWDPVENSSLLPWLAATALLHSLIVTEKRDVLHGWTLLLCILVFSFSLAGFFLVRSGLLTSVHSFASDPTRGIFILCILTLITGGALSLFAMNGVKIAKKASFNLLSKEVFILANNLILFTLCCTVLLGILYPLLLEFFTNKHISVGAPYFNKIFLPMTAIILLLMGLAPYVKWNKDKTKSIYVLLKIPAVFSFLVGAILVFKYGTENVDIIFVAILSIWLLQLTINYLKDKKATFSNILYKPFIAMELGHLGFAILIFSLAVTTMGYQSHEILAKKGEPFVVAGYLLEYNGEKIITDKNYFARRGEFFISKQGSSYPAIYPEIRVFPIEGDTTTEAAIHRNLLSDLYLVIGSGESKVETSVKIFYRPMVNGLWIGCLLMGLAGIIPLIFRKKKRNA